MARPRSLRARLALGYAGIALLTALLLGAVLLIALPPFFAELERTYVRTASADALKRIEQSGGLTDGRRGVLADEAARIAQKNQVRVQVLGVDGAVLADSGPPPEPGAVSAESRRQAIADGAGRPLGALVVSGGPRQGTGLTLTIMWAWAIAGAVAVAGSATFGYYLSRRVSGPIEDLTRVSVEMADGDLAARARVGGDIEVRQLATSFNEMAEEIEGTFDSLKRFVGDAAHEIGTPLTALQADLELARERPFDDSVPDLLDRSLLHTERIRRLTRDLLALSRLESVGAVSEQQDVDLVELASQVVDSVASRAEQADIELVLEASAPVVAVAGDSAALSRAVENLLDNALKFTPAGGTITVSIALKASDAVLRVSDTGTGIDATELPYVFERFHRARDTAAVPGSGLGLAIVKAIVEAHGGSVAVESGGTGTTVELRLPAA
jgi:two-component system, OmpR family, sensor histidine kinase BaeS